MKNLHFIYAFAGCLRCRDPSQMPGRESNLQIVAARSGIDIQHLTCEIQPRAELRLHRAGINLADVHTAARHDCFCQRAESDRLQLQSFQDADQCAALLTRYIVNLLAEGNAGQLHPRLDRLRRQEIGQRVDEVTVGEF